MKEVAHVLGVLGPHDRTRLPHGARLAGIGNAQGLNRTMDERRNDRDPEQLRRVLALFERASDLAAPEQEAFLESAEDQSEVADAVRAMLHADRERGSDLVASVLAAGPSPDTSPQEDEALPPGHRVGRFTIRRMIGCGGMGTVTRPCRTTRSAPSRSRCSVTTSAVLPPNAGSGARSSL